MSRQKRLRLLVRHFHENGLKLLLETSANVRDLLQLLHVPQLPRIDCSQMRVVPGRFVQRDYRHLESDLVLQAPIRGPQGNEQRHILLYILIEHQSEPDRFMPLRVLESVVMIYKRQLRDWEKEHGNLDSVALQPVLPVVLYTGTRTWDKLGQVRELVALGEELAERIPELQPLFLNVGTTSDEALKQGGPFAELLRLLQQRRIRGAVFEQTFREVLEGLKGLAEHERERWLELLSYLEALLYYEREPDERERLQQILFDSVQTDPHRQEVYDMARTMAEILKEEGRREGEQKGRQEGRQEGQVQAKRQMLERLLRKKFGKVPAVVRKRIEATEQLDLLDAWFDQTLEAKALSEISFKGG